MHTKFLSISLEKWKFFGGAVDGKKNSKLNIKVFYLPTDEQQSCFNRILKFTLKQLLHVSVRLP